MMIKKWYYLLIAVLVLSTAASAQYMNTAEGSVLLEGLDTLYLSRDKRNMNVDADAKNNPFIKKNQTSGTANGMASSDDPGGPGSGGGGFGGPPPDVIVPLDGGVSVLVVTGAALGFFRRKKKPVLKQPLD
jgi:hypothetical protein